VVVRTLSGHISPVEQIKFNHKGDFMATASKDKTVRLWKLNELSEQPIVLSDHHDWIWSIAFTPDDEQLLAGLQSTAETLKGIEETIHAWPTKVETMSNILCGEISRNMTQEEWDLYVGDDLTYVKTCPNYPENNK
jgi:WD40 repeat protein